MVPSSNLTDALNQALGPHNLKAPSDLWIEIVSLSVTHSCPCGTQITHKKSNLSKNITKKFIMEENTFIYIS